MLENGFIKLHRRILRWEWYDDRNTTAVFIHLLLTVNTADEIWHGVNIRRGSRVSSFAGLAKELNLTVKQIRTCLRHLEQTHEVAHVSTRNYTVFSVLNYDAYQARGTAKGASDGAPTDGHGANGGQQRKKEKESQEEKESGARAAGAASAGAASGAQPSAASPAASGVKTPPSAPSAATPPGEKSIYERMRE